jgi:hypothetical protein
MGATAGGRLGAALASGCALGSPSMATRSSRPDRSAVAPCSPNMHSNAPSGLRPSAPGAFRTRGRAECPGR